MSYKYLLATGFKFNIYPFSKNSFGRPGIYLFLLFFLILDRVKMRSGYFDKSKQDGE